jgi:hypothetical protein
MRAVEFCLVNLARDVFSGFFSDIEECLDDKRLRITGCTVPQKHRPACAQRSNPCSDHKDTRQRQPPRLIPLRSDL